MAKETIFPLRLSEEQKEKLKKISKKKLGKENMTQGVRFLIEDYDIE